MSNQSVDTQLYISVDKKVALVLFHNDLRVQDNATLLKAVTVAGDNNGRLLCVYAHTLTNIVNPRKNILAYHYDDMGHARQQFLVETLTDLNESLTQLGNRLLYLPYEDAQLQQNKQESLIKEKDTFLQLCQLIEYQNVTDICVSQTSDYNQNQAYDALRNKYPQIRWHVQSTSTLFDSLPTAELPKSFTQFRKQVELNHNLLNAENNLVIASLLTALPPLPDAMRNSTNNNSACFFNSTFTSQNFDNKVQEPTQFRGGESNAIIHLKAYFDSSAPSTYKNTRNALDDWTNSTKFSAWLANGSLSVKMLLNQLRHYERDVIANESTYWIWFELLWREYFYWYAVNHQQQLFWFRGISNQPPATRFDQTRLQQWQTGTTPYPIVNACMKQLNSTGYMSNRGRQIVASCFIHELGLDWRYGATYFEQQLIDYDVASNWGNWQYLAGVGADPRGCRQFNLHKQTQQYDPNGDFIDKWQGNIAVKS